MNSANQLSNSSLCVVVMFPPKTSALCERVRNDRSCRENEVLDPVYPLPCLPSWSKPLSYRKLPINSAWMTSKISVAMRDRDYHHRKARKSGSAYHWHMFRNLPNFVNKDIKASKSKYYINFIKESKGNASKIWNAVNEASYRKSQSAAPSTLGTRALILGSRNRREKNQIKNCCAGGSAWDLVVTDVPVVL